MFAVRDTNCELWIVISAVVMVKMEDVMCDVSIMCCVLEERYFHEKTLVSFALGIRRCYRYVVGVSFVG